MQKGQTKKSGLSTMQAGKDGIKHELTVVYVPCGVTALTSVVKHTVDDAERAGFKVQSMDIEGAKTLAYPIGKYGKEHPKGIFAYFILSGNGSPTGLSGRLNEHDLVLRYLLVKQQFNLKEYK